MKNRRGFTLVELLVVVAIIGILSTVIVISIQGAQKKARDSRRFADMNQIIKGLQLYKSQNEDLPKATTTNSDGSSASHAGWESSDISKPGEFIENLRPFLPIIPIDPINKVVSDVNIVGWYFIRGGDYYYAYHYYNNGNTKCPASESSVPFAIIAIKTVEVDSNRFKSNVTCGDVALCPVDGATGGIPNTCRNWGTEFDYSVRIDGK